MRRLRITDIANIYDTNHEFSREVSGVETEKFTFEGIRLIGNRNSVTEFFLRTSKEELLTEMKDNGITLNLDGPP